MIQIIENPITYGPGFSVVAESEDGINFIQRSPNDKYSIYIKDEVKEYCVSNSHRSLQDALNKIERYERHDLFDNLLTRAREKRKHKSEIVSKRNIKYLEEGRHQFQTNPELQKIATEKARLDSINNPEKASRVRSDFYRYQMDVWRNTPITHIGHVYNMSDDELRKLYLGGMAAYRIAKQYDMDYNEVYCRLLDMHLIRSRAEIMSTLWKENENFRAKHPIIAYGQNKCEKEIEKLLDECRPGEFKYNGCCDLGIVINHKIPDFVNINGKKQIIEHNGCYYHSCPIHCPDNWEDGHIPTIKQIEFEQSKSFSEVGFDVLIIWEHELKDLSKVRDRLVNFR